VSATETSLGIPAGASSGPISPLTGALMAVVGVFAFSALLVLLTYAPDLRGGDDGGAQALSKSAVGFAGIVEALRLAREPVLVNRAALSPGRHGGLLVVTPTVSTSRQAIEGLSFGGPVLVVLPKWLVLPLPTHRGWVGKAGLIDPGMFDRGSIAARAGLRRRGGVGSPVLHLATGMFPGGGTLHAGPVDSLQVLTAPGWVPVLVDDAGETILARDPRGPFYVLSDPDLMNTQGVRDVRTLATALAILRALRIGDGAVVFDVRLNGLGRERNLGRLLFDPPFLGVTLCLVAAAALAGLQALVRFGPVRRGGRAIPLGKTALVDNTAALVRLAGREHRLGGRYADLTADLAARAVGAPRGLGGEPLAALLDRLGARRGLGTSLTTLESEARSASSAVRLVAAADQMFRWRVDLTAGAGEGAGARSDPPMLDRHG
jgi:hypothetical protein